MLGSTMAQQSVQPKKSPDLSLDKLKQKDISQLWIGAIPLIDREDTLKLEWVERPDPIGYIGKDFKRFYIHTGKICRSAGNPLCYELAGETRTGDNICAFEGELHIDSLQPYQDNGFDVWGGIYSGWRINGHYVLRENPENNGSGVLEGIHTLDIAADMQGNIYYDTMYLVADGYSNSQWKGTWRSYKTGAAKPCNWGDFRIPDSRQLDSGCGLFIPDEKYRKNGWQSYYDADGQPNQNPGTKAAQDEESRRWWIYSY